MRYKQDLAKFLLIADAARLIQERAGISEDEAREDIVRAVQDYSVRVLLSDVRKDGRHLRKGSDDHIVRELSPERIDWETSIAERRSLYASFTVEIEVSRSNLNWLWAAPDGDEEWGATLPPHDEPEPQTDAENVVPQYDAREGEQDTPQAHDAQPSTPAKADQAQTEDELKDWFVNIYVPAHRDDSPNPTRDVALSAAKLEFPKYCDRTHLRNDLRKIWRTHAPKRWKRRGPRAKTE